MIKAIKIFEHGGKYNQDEEEILDDVSDGVILINENKTFEGVLYKEDEAIFISGYLGQDVISIDMLGKSINAIKQDDDNYLGVAEIDSEEENESPCRVILSKLKENNNIETNKLNDIIYSLKTNKIMILERNLHK